MKAIMNNILGKIEFFLSLKRLNIIKTLYINFRSLPFKQAIKLPIFVYGGIKIVSLRGRIIIESPIKRGMIELGSKTCYDFVPSSKSKIFNNGVIVFKGQASFLNGVHLYLSMPNSIIEIGLGCYFAENSSILTNSNCKISIGDYSRIAYYTTINNSDFHYIIDNVSRKIHPNNDIIEIGKYNWIGNGVRVLKRAKTPDRTIVTANSILNKDYCESIDENSILGGIPAKLIKTGQTRIFSVKNENMLNEFFCTHPQGTFVLDDSMDIVQFCNRE